MTTTTRPRSDETRLIPVPPTVRDIGLLITRVLLGVILIAHGWEKFVLDGLSTTGEAFESMGVPAAQAAAMFAGAVELIGGILLIIGLLTPIVAALVVIVMFGAYLLVHMGAGVFAADGGWELVAVIGLAVVVFALVGTGRYSVDALIASRKAQKA